MDSATFLFEQIDQTLLQTVNSCQAEYFNLLHYSHFHPVN